MEVVCRCVEDEGRRRHHTAGMRNVLVVVAHARWVVMAPLLRFVAPAPCGTSLACSWPGEQVLIGASGMCGERLTTRCMEAFMAFSNSFFGLSSVIFYMIVLTFVRLFQLLGLSLGTVVMLSLLMF